MNVATMAEQNLMEFGVYERIVCDGVARTNQAVHEMSRSAAGGFASLGVGVGSRVAVIASNGPEVVAIYPGVWRLGATCVPVSPLLEGAELRCVLQHSAPTVVVTDEALHAKVCQAIDALPARPAVVIIGRGPTLTDAIAFGELLERGRTNSFRHVLVARGRGDVAMIVYTSGTTSRPKGVVQTHGNLEANTSNAYRSLSLRRPGERHLLILPLAHTFGVSMLLLGYRLGVHTVMMRAFDPGRALALIEHHRVQFLAAVPTMLSYMMWLPEGHRYDTSSMVRWLAGGAPMPPETIRAFERRFGGRVCVGYGLTEASPTLANERENGLRKAGTAGPPLDGVALRIVDDAGQPLPAGERGEICARGHNISPGYYRDPQATAESFRDGWLHTGDIGYLDEDGYLFVVDRKKDLIICNGLNVYPADVEDVVRRYPAVIEAAVVGVDSSSAGEDVCAYVVRRDGAALDAEDLIAHCHRHLATYKLPRHVALLPALPRTSLGKVDRKALRHDAAGRFGEGDPARTAV